MKSYQGRVYKTFMDTIAKKTPEVKKSDVVEVPHHTKSNNERTQSAQQKRKSCCCKSIFQSIVGVTLREDGVP